MHRITLGKTGIPVSRIALGCMRMAGIGEADAHRLIRTAMEHGITFFDHADIYGGGESERLFAKAAGMSPAIREKMILQSKCGICKGYFDFSKKHSVRAYHVRPESRIPPFSP